MMTISRVSPIPTWREECRWLSCESGIMYFDVEDMPDNARTWVEKTRTTPRAEISRVSGGRGRFAANKDGDQRRKHCFKADPR